MFYRLILKLLTNKKDGSVHRVAETLIFFFCQLSRLIPIKRSFPASPVNVMGLSFANPMGLAAGFDRTGKFLAYSELIGFGFIEIGTLNIDATKLLDNTIITTLQNLNKASKNKHQTKHPQQWGINLGSLRNILDDKTVADYTKGMDLFWQYANYLVINLSRPESDARALKPDLYGLDLFLSNIQYYHQILTTKYGQPVPLLAKIAIDYRNNESVAEILLLLKQRGFDGVILAFENWPDIQQIAHYLYKIKADNEAFPFIVVGGIRSTQDSQQLMAAGASLTQIYTALVQQGPFKIRQMIAKHVGKG